MDVPNTNWSVKCADSHMKRHPNMPDHWHHSHGVCFSAISKVWRKTGDKKYFDYIKRNIDVVVDENGKIKNYPLNDFKLDSINCGKLFFSLYKETGDERYKNALYFLKEHLRIQPTTKEGLYWHKRIMPYQSVLDGTYMYMPFVAEFEKTFNTPGYFDGIIKQIFTITKNTYDENSGLYYQGFDETKEIFWADKTTGHSFSFWARADAWFAMTLVDCLDFIPVSHPDRYKLIKLLSDLMLALVKVQDSETGLWYQVLDQIGRKGNYLEASACGMIIYAMSKGIRKGYLNHDIFLDAVNKAYKGELSKFVNVNSDGFIDVKTVCINVDLGATHNDDSTYEFYVNAPVGDNDLKGISTFMLASYEYEQIEPYLANK